MYYTEWFLNLPWWFSSTRDGVVNLALSKGMELMTDESKLREWWTETKKHTYRVACQPLYTLTHVNMVDSSFNRETPLPQPEIYPLQMSIKVDKENQTLPSSVLTNKPISFFISLTCHPFPFKTVSSWLIIYLAAYSTWLFQVSVHYFWTFRRTNKETKDLKPLSQK